MAGENLDWRRGTTPPNGGYFENTRFFRTENRLDHGRRQLAERSWDFEDGSTSFRGPGSYLRSSGGHRGSSNWRCHQQDCDWMDEPERDLYGSSTPSLTPDDLVVTLTQFQTYSASFGSLLQENEAFQSSLIREMAFNYPHIFHINDDSVELRPKITLCAPHSNAQQGCMNISSCAELHICRQYVLSRCVDGFTCGFGHRWRTDHNISVLRHFFLEGIELPILRKLVQLVLRPESTTGQLVQLCNAYNEGKCSVTDCSALHLCLSYAVGLARCSKKDCELNHNILNTDCSRVLIAHGLNTNESPRDILRVVLTANPTIAMGNEENGVGGAFTSPSSIKHVRNGVEETKKGNDAKKLPITTKLPV